MDSFKKDLDKVLTRELKKKQGGGLGSIVGKLSGKILPLVMKHAPKIIPALGLAAVSGAISGSTHKATAGSGLYREYGLMLSDNQKQKLQSAKEGVTLRLSKDQLSGSDKLLLTKSQINKIQKAQRAGNGMDLKLSATQMKKQGGFVGALLAGLAAPLIGKVLGFGQKARAYNCQGRREVEVAQKKGPEKV